MPERAVKDFQGTLPLYKPVVDKKFKGHFLRPGHAMRRGVVGANLAVARFIGRHQP